MAKRKTPRTIETLIHDEASRRNIPTAEFGSVMERAEQGPVQVAYERRNRDLDLQLVWRGKDAQDWSDLVVQAPPLFIQEKVHPKVLIDDLRRQTKDGQAGQDGDGTEIQPDLFADFNGLPSDDARTEFYQHDANWSNRMILGDSLQVMASLAEREGLRGKVQCIYLDPPYGIKFNSNFQWSTTSRDVKDGKAEHISREPEQVKAFRDTWRDGIHSYLTYLRDRLVVARDLLSESGSIFMQIGDENVHRVRALMDEVFGEENFCNFITFKKTGGLVSGFLPSTADYLLWYCCNRAKAKFRQVYLPKAYGADSDYRHVRLPDLSVRRLTRAEAESVGNIPSEWRVLQTTSLESANPTFELVFRGRRYSQRWKTNYKGLERLAKADRLYEATAKLRYLRYVHDFPAIPVINNWDDTGSSGYRDANVYVVQTVAKVAERCMLMATDPGDLVLDPTCGSGTTAYVAEQWGRRWITIDTSRVALTLARARVMGARYPYYLLADSSEGQRKEAEITRKVRSEAPTRGDPVPELRTFGAPRDEAAGLADWLRARRDEGYAPHEIGVFVRSIAQVERAIAAVREAGLTPVELDVRPGGASGSVAVGTMHLAKGLEFRAVAVAACDDDVIPLQSRIEAVADEADLEDVYATERHLLYVACTRARDRLLVTGVEPASEFLDDLRVEGQESAP